MQRVIIATMLQSLQLSSFFFGSLSLKNLTIESLSSTKCSFSLKGGRVPFAALSPKKCLSPNWLIFGDKHFFGDRAANGTLPPFKENEHLVDDNDSIVKFFNDNDPKKKDDNCSDCSIVAMITLCI